MADLNDIKDFIMNVVNGNAPVSTMVVRNTRESAKQVTAEASHAFETAKVVTLQLGEIGVEIAKLEGLKIQKQTELTLAKDALAVVDTEIDVMVNIVDKLKQRKAALQKTKAKSIAKKKTNGESVDNTEESQDEIPENQSKLKKLQDKRKGYSDKVSTLQNEIDSYDNQIKELRKQINILNAQISPRAALVEAQSQKEKAQNEFDSASTPEAKEQAQKQLDEATSMEETIQQVASDTQTSIQQTQEQQEPEMMMIQADFELMKAGVNTINYLVTNIPVFFTGASASIGANGGGPVPMLPNVSLSLGNILFGFAFCTLANVKSASIRFMANCQKIGYIPTTEMNIINQIPTTEASLMGLTGIAPGGMALSQL